MKDAVVLFLAALVMVGLVLIPRQHRRIQVAAVLTWAMIWVDNAFTGHWSDWLGVTVTLAILGAWLPARQVRRTDRST